MLYECHEITAWQQFFHLTKSAHIKHHKYESCLNMLSTESKDNDEWNYNPVSIDYFSTHTYSKLFSF